MKNEIDKDLLAIIIALLLVVLIVSITVVISEKNKLDAGLIPTSKWMKKDK